MSAAGNVIGANVIASSNIILSYTSNSTSDRIIRFSDANTAVTTVGANIGAIEWFTSDSAPSARVTAAIRAVYSDSLGNANILIQTANTTAATRIAIIGASGNVGVANTAPLHTFAVSGTMYGSSTLVIAGNVGGGNFVTSGLLTAQGNVTGANLRTAGLVTATGNVTGGNVISLGAVSAGAGGVSATGNITGGNLLSQGIISASGNLTTTDIYATSLSATGNLQAGNLNISGLANTQSVTASATVSAAGNITAANLRTGGSVSAVGNLIGGGVSTNGIVSAAGNVVSGAYFIGDGGYLSNITVTSNVAVTQLANGTTNWTIRGTTGPITGDVNAVANVVIITTDLFTMTGNISATGNVIGAHLTTAGTISATGNITGGNVTATIGNFNTVIGVANASNLTTGTVPSDRLAGVYTIDIGGYAATVSAASQPNITSVGNMSGLSVVGNIQTGNLLTNGLISAAGNITGNFILGNGACLTGVITSVANINNGTSNVTIATANGNVTVGVDGTNNVVVVTATSVNVTGSISASGNITGSNLNAANLSLSGNVLSAINTTANITGSNLNAANLSLSGNVLSAINTTANITGDLFFGNGVNLTSLNASNISSGTLSQDRLANSSLTVNGQSISLGGSGTVTANTTNTLTIGSGLGGTSFNGGTAVTITNTGVLSLANGGGITASASSGAVTLGSTATSANTASAIVARDASGNFTANTITANITGSATTAGTVTTAAQPNITSVGSLTSLTVGNILNSNANAVGNIGNSTVYFNTIHAKATSALYADLAERFLADQPYAPGTVLIFGGEKEVTQSVIAADHRVAGVVSTNPSYIMNAALAGPCVVDLALQGRVPCDVVGPVEKGDLMVSAPNGRAQATKSAQAGTVIGKSLENFSGTFGRIEIVIGRD
jgi:hypothetical protein